MRKWLVGLSFVFAVVLVADAQITMNPRPTGTGVGDAMVSGSLAQFAATSSAQLANVISDETGSGVVVFGTAPVFTTSLSIGSAGVRLSDDGDGALVLLGLGDGFDEDLIINLDDVSNTVGVSSSTGVTQINFTSITLNPAAYKVGGTAGATGTTCSQFTGGLCTAATLEVSVTQQLADLRTRIAQLEQLVMLLQQQR
jgi:hypothetical protein